MTVVLSLPDQSSDVIFFIYLIAKILIYTTTLITNWRDLSEKMLSTPLKFVYCLVGDGWRLYS